MFNLIDSYLILMILLFGVNIGLIQENLKLSNIKSAILSLSISLLFFIVLNLATYFNRYFYFLKESFHFLFIITSVILFTLILTYFKNNKNFKVSLIIVIGLFLTVCFALFSQNDEFLLINSLLFSLLLFIVLFLIYQLNKLLIYTKREFYIITNEFMIIESIFIFICGLSYSSTKNLNHEMFSSFLILTPTYKIIYLIISILFLMVIGMYFNNRYMKKRFN